LGVDQEVAASYQRELNEDSLLLAVMATEENEDKATSIMREANATLASTLLLQACAAPDETGGPGSVEAFRAVLFAFAGEHAGAGS
jgi:hypothetical protein